MQAVCWVVLWLQLKKDLTAHLSCSLDVFGDKWSLLIIMDLMFNKKCTCGGFLKSEEGIATQNKAAANNALY